MEDKITLQGWAFVLTLMDHIQLAEGEINREIFLKVEDIKGFIGVLTLGMLMSFQIFLTREAMHEGAEIARKAGCVPIEMTVPVPVDEEMMRMVAERDD